MTSETRLPVYLPYPVFLLSSKLTHTARLLYTLLLSRTTLSQKNGWMDENGHIYVVFTVKGMSQMIGRGTTVVKAALNELEANELIERRHRGFSAPSRIFVKLPSFGRKSDLMMDGKPTVIEPESRPSYSRETNPMRVGKPSPNYLSINYRSNNYMRGASATNVPTSYGQYKNVLLTETELATLQGELPDRWQHYIERLSEYMASTGKRYKNHLATIRRWAADDAKKNAPKQWIPDYTYEEGESL